LLRGVRDSRNRKSRTAAAEYCPANSAQFAFRPVALNFIFADYLRCLPAPNNLHDLSAPKRSASGLYLRQNYLRQNYLRQNYLRQNYLRQVMPNKNATPATIASVV
jgi:hypothetical protein